MIIRILLSTFSFVLLAAHFLRIGNLPLTVGCLCFPLLWFVKTRWSPILLQVFTYVGTLIWIRTTFQIYRSRIAFGMPWGRAVVILTSVALFTLGSGLLLNARIVKEKYPSKHNRE